MGWPNAGDRGDAARLAATALTGAGEQLHRAGAEIGSVRDGYGVRVLGPLASGRDWLDGGQQHAVPEAVQLHRMVGELPPTMRTASAAVHTWADGLAGVQRRLQHLETVATDHGLRIEDDGTIAGDGADEVRDALQARLGSLLADAADIDDTCARRLTALLEDTTTGSPLADRAGQSLLAPPMPPAKDGGGLGGGPDCPATHRRRPRQLLPPPLPPQRPLAPPPNPTHPWTGSGKTTAQLKASGKDHQSGEGKNELSRAGRILDKHNDRKRPGHDEFPDPKGNGRNRSKIAQRSR
ncbi:MAG: hypothetical protein GEV07_22860 [Streptosporangiales bacterium]|nr:hypothetical protein [Streptosporangiales bacterium]